MTFIFLHRKAGSSRMRSIPKFHHGMMLCNARVGVKEHMLTCLLWMGAGTATKSEYDPIQYTGNHVNSMPGVFPIVGFIQPSLAN